MHLGNGDITPMCAVYGATIAGTSLAATAALSRLSRRSDATTDADASPPSLYALATAGVFAAQAFNVPVLPGVSGHLLGGTLVACAFGPARGVLAMSIVLLAQATLFGDGGLAALGVNALTMAVLPCLVVWPLARRLLGAHRPSAIGVGVAAAIATILGALLCSAALCSRISSIDGAVQIVATMLAVHAPIAVLEGALTAGALVASRWLWRLVVVHTTGSRCVRCVARKRGGGVWIERVTRWT
jgi:cobalt/nickel transport system permease protein